QLRFHVGRVGLVRRDEPNDPGRSDLCIAVSRCLPDQPDAERAAGRTRVVLGSWPVAVSAMGWLSPGPEATDARTPANLSTGRHQSPLVFENPGPRIGIG